MYVCSCVFLCRFFTLSILIDNVSATIIAIYYFCITDI